MQWSTVILQDERKIDHQVLVSVTQTLLWMGAGILTFAEPIPSYPPIDQVPFENTGVMPIDHWAGTDRSWRLADVHTARISSSQIRNPI